MNYVWVDGRPVKGKNFKSKPFVKVEVNPCAMTGCYSSQTEKIIKTNERGETVLIPLCSAHKNI